LSVERSACAAGLKKSHGRLTEKVCWTVCDFSPIARRFDLQLAEVAAHRLGCCAIARDAAVNPFRVVVRHNHVCGWNLGGNALIAMM
jgi:hypothetical protein